ncbi:CBS domain-containing protein [Candidatus Kaiserbacteria bacterium]|nr:CBS domain-containing protein [Candidatus Kaiserbacteria bacterium]
MEVKDIIKDAVTISEEASFREALAAMVGQKTNTLLVVDESGSLTGEVTVADLMDAIVPEYLDGDNIAANFATEDMFEQAVLDASEQQVKFFMSHDFSVVELDDGLMAIAATAIAHQRARIPVVDKDNHPVGIISRQGLKHIIAQFLGIEDSA